MKKKLFFLVAITVIAVSLFACTHSENYEDINQMIKQNYSEISLQVKTTVGEEVLTDKITVKNENKKTKINYAIERLTEISLSEIPANYKTEKRGSLTVENGKVVDKNGDDVDFDLSTITATGFNFQPDYFTKPSWSSGTLSATVANPAGFFGISDFTCTDMKITVKYDTAIKSMTITYKTANAKVEMRYTFSK